MSRERIEHELEFVRAGGCEALVTEARWEGNGTRLAVIYRQLPTSGSECDLPPVADVIVPVPPGYPGAAIDLAGLEADSPLLPRLRGGQNNQGILHADNRVWRLASYHPHNARAGSWNPSIHGFHTYVSEVLSWLANID